MKAVTRQIAHQPTNAVFRTCQQPARNTASESHGAGDGTRTRTGLPPTVFKTVASAISPLRPAAHVYDSTLTVPKQPGIRQTAPEPGQ
jgi:hypothetical protein